MSTDTRNEELINITAVCQLLGGVSRSTIIRWIKHRGLPANPGPTGRNYKFRPSEVIAWHDQFKVNQ